MSDLSRIYSELQLLGVTPNYKGYRQTALAVELALQNEESLSHITKGVYKAVAAQTGCTKFSVERNIRTAAHVAWEINPARLAALAGYPISSAPSALGLVTILVSHIQRAQPASTESPAP